MTAVKQQECFYVYTHLGLGDQLICNAIIRNISKKFTNKRIVVFCKERCKVSINFMLRDLLNVEIIAKDDYDVQCFLDNIAPEDKIYIGHQNFFSNLQHVENAEKSFYQQVGLNFNKKWSDFYVERDIAREQLLFDRYSLQGKKYIIIQDDQKNNRIINKNIINTKDVEVFVPDESITDNLFDYLTIVENAQEIHCVESCFMYMMDLCFATIKAELYAHRYARPLHRWELPSMRLNWNVIN